MLKFLYKKVYNRDKYFPICENSRALLHIFGFSSIDSEDSINALKKIIPLEVEEIVNTKNIPKKYRKNA